MLSSSNGLSGLAGLPGLSGRAGVLYGAHAPPRLYQDEDDDDDEEDDSTDEYGSCTEAPLYENVDDEEEEEQGVYENMVFEQPAYCNLRGGAGLVALGDDDAVDEEDDQVYANVPGPEDEAPTYDVPQRRPAAAHILAAPQEYANLGATAATATTAVAANSTGGLGVILEESESSARSSSGSSGRGSSCASAASSLARSSSSTPASSQRPASAASGLSGLLARIRGGVTSSGSGQDAALTASQRGSRDSGLNEVEWTSTKATSVSVAASGRTAAYSHDAVQQATPERLARVQQQVRLHMQEQEEEHYQQPRPLQQQQPKLSVRDLLGRFEARRAAADGPAPPSGNAGNANGVGAARAARAAPHRAVTSTPGSAGVARGPGTQRSYGFGSSTTTTTTTTNTTTSSVAGSVKNVLRKSVSQPADTGLYNNVAAAPAAPSGRQGVSGVATKTVFGGGADSNKGYGAIYSNGHVAAAQPVKPYGGSKSHSSAAPPAATNNNSRSNKFSNNNNNNINHSASNSVNNKLSSNNNNNSNNTNSRRSFLDSIIASAASADGGGRGSRRSVASATMEEVNNILNAATQSPQAGRQGRHAADTALNGGHGGHPALRKAASTTTSSSNTTSSGGSGSSSNRSSRSGSVDKEMVVVADAAPANGGSLQDIPSIVDQLPDDDRPQESRKTTSQWDPAALVAALYSVPEPLRDKPRPVDRVNLEGFLERLPSGRTKATFWNAWKRCYFRAKDGFLYCYAGKHSEKPMDVTQLMGGKVEPFESMVITAQDRNPATVPVIGIDDRMGHYLVVRASTPQETDRWVRALQTHTVEDFCSTYVQPWPVPRAPALLRDSIVIDLGSRSVRAGILCSQPSLPQVFFPAVCAIGRRGLASGLAASLGVSTGSAGDKVYGPAALQPSVRANSTLGYPIRPTERINKHTVDLAAVSGLLRVVFQSLSVEPRDYGVVLSVPRTLDGATQARLVAELFDRFGVRSVLLSHQTVLALYAYNAASGVVVDIGERTDVVPIMDGYIVEGGVSRVPYGGEEMAGHVRRFLLQRAPPVSLGTVAEALLPRYALERLCFVSPSYRADLRRAQRDPTEVAASVSVSEFFAPGSNEPTLESLTLDSGRFQAPEGLFHPQAWGLDHPGVHRMVHKAIQECSMDARKTMARSVFLAGGLTMLPGFADRLREELAALLPPAAQPKVHASPYRYHAAYLGACVLANSSGVQEMCLTRDEYHRDGGRLLRPWIL